MFVFERDLFSCFRTKFVTIVHIVPTKAHLQVEVAQIEVDWQELGLQLVVTDIIIQIAIRVDIHIITTVAIAEHRTGKADGMDGYFSTYHHELT